MYFYFFKKKGVLNFLGPGLATGCPNLVDVNALGVRRVYFIFDNQLAIFTVSTRLSLLQADLLSDDCVGGAGLEDGGQRAVVGEHAAADVHGLQPELHLRVVQDDDTHLEGDNDRGHEDNEEDTHHDARLTVLHLLEDLGHGLVREEVPGDGVAGQQQRRHPRLPHPHTWRREFHCKSSVSRVNKTIYRESLLRCSTLH